VLRQTPLGQAFRNAVVLAPWTLLRTRWHSVLNSFCSTLPPNRLLFNMFWLQFVSAGDTPQMLGHLYDGRIAIIQSHTTDTT
jgi:hypothetical protein